MTRDEILEEARQEVTQDRAGTYGSPEDNFAVIGRLWSEYLRARYKVDIVVTGHDVAMMQIQLKIARVATGLHHDDNYVDIAGYAACAGSCDKGFMGGDEEIVTKYYG